MTTSKDPFDRPNPEDSRSVSFEKPRDKEHNDVQIVLAYAVRNSRLMPPPQRFLGRAFADGF